MEKNGITTEKLNLVWSLMGFAAVLATMVPGILLGQDGIFTYHDQLDGELIAYLLQARHLFQGDILPEFLNGASKTALTLPAPLFVLLFLSGDGCSALNIMLLIGRITGYFGMYLLCRTKVREGWIAAGVSVLFSCLPFLPVYGLSQFGIPLLFWCVLCLQRKKHMIPAFCYVAVYTLCSSLVLVGFGLLGMGILLLLWELWKIRSDAKRRPAFFRLLSAWLLMLGIYVAVNCRLLWQLLGNGAVSHKTEYILEETSFFDVFFPSLLQGIQHGQGYHIFLVVTALVGAVVWRVREKSLRRESGEEEKARLKAMEFCLGWNLLFAAIAAAWNCALGLWLREKLTALGAFQMNRVLWIAPCLWYLFCACGMALIWKMLLETPKNPLSWCCGLAAAAAVCFTGIQIFLAGDIKTNIQKLRDPDYKILSFSDYYAIGVMDQVMGFLQEETGMSPREYRVASLGIDPAAALYQGFYCLDGYSNNYSLDYKHAFRELLEPELERSDYLRKYFDDWGNRCYLFSSECPGYYTIEKNGFYFQDYQLDTEAMRRLGGRYLLSAAYIANAEEIGLKLLREAPFETACSYYRIFVYEVT